MKVAILAANGFQEQDLTAIQRALLPTGANMRIISPESGLIHGWNGENWGHHFAIDTPINNALGSDYNMLVIPSGQRSVDKLKLTAHTKRFIGNFMAVGKPVAAMGDALNILIYGDFIRGLTVGGPAALEDMALTAGAMWRGAAANVDNYLLTGVCSDDVARAGFVAKAVDLFCKAPPLLEAA